MSILGLNDFDNSNLIAYWPSRITSSVEIGAHGEHPLISTHPIYFHFSELIY
jgi:hypothetical protein